MDITQIRDVALAIEGAINTSDNLASLVVNEFNLTDGNGKIVGTAVRDGDGVFQFVQDVT